MLIAQAEKCIRKLHILHRPKNFKIIFVLQKNEDDLNADIDELFKQGKIIKEFSLDLDLTGINM
jgi:hypothetical protein